MPQQPDDLTAFQRDAARLASIVDSSDDAIVSKDLKSTVLSWNAAAERMFGFTAADIIGRSIRLLIPADRQNEEDEVLARIRRGERVEHYETVRRRKDGTLLTVSLTVSPLRDSDGTIIGASKIARDITEQTRLALENARLFTEAQEANRLKDDFLAVLSHELRTPLNAIVGYARLLRDGVLPADKASRGLEILDRNATWLTQIVEDVLDVSRIVSGKIRLDIQPVEMLLVANNALTTVQAAADAKGVHVQSSVDPFAGPVSGDPGRLQQVIWNLLSNAVKFTPAGGHVDLVVKQAGAHVEIIVSDSGAGITAAFLPHVFDRFRQADSGTTRATGGLGLGLSIVRHIVEMHGGTVDATSLGEGCGATFTVRLPLTVDHAHPIEVPRAIERAPRRAPRTEFADLRGIRVLAVDDEKDALSLLREILEAAGADVTTLGSAADVVNRIDAVRPDALVLDLGMPGIDGFELIRQIRQSTNGAVRNVPAAALTAFARAEDRTRALRSGFEMHLAKPVDPSELVASVATLARRSRTTR